MAPNSYEDSYEQRTTLAWNRTALTFGAVPLVGAKLAFNTAPWLGFALTLLGIAGAILLLALAERHAAGPVRSSAVLALLTISMAGVLVGLFWTG